VTSAATYQPGVALDAAEQASTRSDAVLMLQVFALAVMVVPSDMVIAAIGASGYLASLIGAFILAAYTASILFGLHDPGRHRHPIRAVLCVLWLSVLASYVLMDRGLMSDAQLKSADRFMIQLGVITGVALVAAEWLRSLEEVRRVLRALCWGGAFCGVVAAVQFRFGYDLSHYLRVPGFTPNADIGSIGLRADLNRSTGTAVSPIELGVVAGMLAPIAVYLGLYDRKRRPLIRWAPLPLILLSVSASVSRSAIISVAVAFGVLVILLPPVMRVIALCWVPVVVTGAFMLAHGLIGTLAGFFAAGGGDSSVQYRTHDYPLAEQLWQHAPLFGAGPGTYLPLDPLNIFDNQYLGTAVELGIVGLAALTVFLVAPAIIALRARRRSTNPELQLLCAALAGAGFAGALCSLTFDSLSFPMFVNVYALVIGLIGACWRLAAAERAGMSRPLRTALSTRGHAATSQTALSTGG